MDRYETVLLDGNDHKGRRWLITARTYDGNGKVMVNFRCWNANGRSKALDQTTAWLAEGWSLARPWLPTSPRPVPTAILDAVERKLKQGVGRG